MTCSFLKALNWLLKSVTQPTCLHDLLWNFVNALGHQNSEGSPAAEDAVVEQPEFVSKICFL